MLLGGSGQVHAQGEAGSRPVATARRVVIGDEQGRAIVARMHSAADPRVVMLPDGRLGYISAVVETQEAFRPLDQEALKRRLLAGEFAKFDAMSTRHYLVLYRCSEDFARKSAELLENLYGSLGRWFGERGFPVHEAEFPLVMVIFRSEREFRRHRAVDPDVQAYYDVISNRIYAYEWRDRDLDPPEVAIWRQPQTIAHEGTHQILQNIGIQPRLAEWPRWLSEGLAEFCASNATHGAGAGGFPGANPMHLATLQDLSMSPQEAGAGLGGMPRPWRRRATPIEELIMRDQFGPSDYARSWSLVYFLANSPLQARFQSYLKRMGRLAPLERRTGSQNREEFARAFSPNWAKLNLLMGTFYQPLLERYRPDGYYCVLFEQLLPDGNRRTATLVTPSPAVVQEWLEDIAEPEGGPARWEVMRRGTRQEAAQAARGWLEQR
jgi:hypothetical protein